MVRWRLGAPNAPVVVIEHSDFQCPYCGEFARNVFPALKARYVATGQVRWVFRHLPLQQIHPRALPAAIAAECARRQDKFWEMHDLLFGDQTDLTDVDLARRASTLGLDKTTFEPCVASGAGDRVRGDLAVASAIGIAGTPTFLIGRALDGNRVRVVRRIGGSATTAPFDEAIAVAGRRPGWIGPSSTGTALGFIGAAVLGAWLVRRRAHRRAAR